MLSGDTKNNQSFSVTDASTMLDNACRCACMHAPALADLFQTDNCVSQDPQRRKLLPYAFYQSLDGYTTLQCSGTLYVAQRTQADEQSEDESKRDNDAGGGVVQVVCCADVLLPFIIDTSPLELLEDTSISILPSTTPPVFTPTATDSPSSPSRWWLCDLLRCDDVPGVQSAIDQLTYLSNEWAVGWQAQSHPTPATTTSSSPSLRSSPPRYSHSAATFAVLRVKRPLNPKQYRSAVLSPDKVLTSPVLSPFLTSSLPHISSPSSTVSPIDFPAFPPLSFLSSRSLRRGSDVRVIASPYGLLSPAVFHNSVSGGIVSNVVHASTTSVLSDQLAEASGGVVSHDIDTALASFPSSDVSFPRHLHFPIQVHPTSSSSSSSSSSSPSSAASHSASVERQAFASVFLTDCRCLPGSEGAPVVLSTLPVSQTMPASAVLAGLVTLPLHLTNVLSPVLLNNVVSAEAVWYWLHQDQRTVPHPRFHYLSPSTLMTSAVVSPSSLTSSTTVSSALSSRTPPFSTLSTQSASSRIPSSPSPVSPPSLSVVGMVERAERSLAIAKVQSSWASGIVLTADGYIATNAHLLAPFHNPPIDSTTAGNESTAPSFAPSLSATVSVCLSSSSTRLSHRRRWHKATVVYVCRSPWDLALLKISPPSPLTAVTLPPPSSQPAARPGDTVYVLGHALFSPSSMMMPTLTRGVLSQYVSLSHSPVLLQTDSAVHNGNSGGLLLSQYGLCLGMVTSNIQHTALPPTADAPNTSHPPPPSPTLIIPQLNLSVPAAVLCRLRSHIQQHVAGGSAIGGAGVWSEWEAGESGWRAEVERMWGLSAVDVWEVDVKPRSKKYREVVERVQRMERERLEQEQQQQLVVDEHADRRARL